MKSEDRLFIESKIEVIEYLMRIAAANGDMKHYKRLQAKLDGLTMAEKEGK